MKRETNLNPTSPDQLDALLRQWHDQNAKSARDNRDALLARLAEQDKGVVARIGEGQGPPTIVTRRNPMRLLASGWAPVAASLAIMVSLVAFMMGGQPGAPRAGVAMLGGPGGGGLTNSLAAKSAAAGRMFQAAYVSDGGRLDAVDDAGRVVGTCPLEHTDVEADIQGQFARVIVRQRYANPFADKIEAVYTFPLSNTGAVDRMTMTIGDRVIVGEVKERTVARNIYEQARSQGRAAALLEQERPNIFTQSVANIEPGAQITVEISYVELVQSNEGEYSFSFPMTVAPRYIPGYATATEPDDHARDAEAEVDWDALPDGEGLEWLIEPGDQAPAAAEALADRTIHSERPDHSPESGEPAPGAPFADDTDQVPDASRITPAPLDPRIPGNRAGHDISIEVNLQTGGPGIVELNSVLHEIEKTDFIKPNDFTAPVGALIRLKDKNEIPNKDFVLKWRLADESIENQVFATNGEQGGFLTLSILPPARVTDAQAVPRELVFVLDTSGSMNGFPIEKAKEVMTRAIAQMRPIDSFNIITFAGSTRILWEAPRPGTPDNIAEANAFVNGRAGSGGTEMMSAINAALSQTVRTPKRGWITPREFNDLYKHGDDVTLHIRMTGQEYLDVEGKPSFQVPVADGSVLTTQVSNWTLNLGVVDPQSIVTLKVTGRYERRGTAETLVVSHAELISNDFISVEQLMNLPADGRRVEVLINSFDTAHDPLFETADDKVHPLSQWVAHLRMTARIIEHEFRKATVVGRWLTKDGQRVLVMDRWGDVPERESVRPVRICMFLTDGQVGNDHTIIEAVRKNAGTTRVFSFGVGNSPNRYLLDGIALAGRGAADYVTLADGADPIVDRFAERIRTPVLSDVRIEFNAPAPVLDVVSANVLGELRNDDGRNDIFLLPDLYERRPITLHGRFNYNGAAAAGGSVTITGRTAEGPYQRTIPLSFPPASKSGALASQRSVLPTLWAREKVNQVLSTDLSGLQLGTPKGDVRRQVVTLGETFSIMTPFTSFVAVDRARVTIAGRPRLVHIPIEMPEGQSFDGVFGQACRHLIAANPVVIPTPDQLGVATEGQFADRFDRMRELQMQQKYQEALQVAEEILAIDPTNETAHLMKPVYEDILFYIQWESIDRRRSKSVTAEALKADESLSGRRSNEDEIQGLLQRMLTDADERTTLLQGETGRSDDLLGFDGDPAVSGGGLSNFTDLAGQSDGLESGFQTRSTGGSGGYPTSPDVLSVMNGSTAAYIFYDRGDSSGLPASASAPLLGEIPLAGSTVTAETRDSSRARPNAAERVRTPERSEIIENERQLRVREREDQFDKLVELGQLDDAEQVRQEILFIDPDNEAMKQAGAAPADADLGLPAPAPIAESGPVDQSVPTEEAAAGADRGNIATADEALADRAEQIRRRFALYAWLARVLHPDLQRALSEALSPARDANGAILKSVEPDRLSVTVLLADTDDATIAAVRKAGLRTDAVNQDLSVVVGAIPPARLLDLALTPGVRRVEPTRAD